MYYAHTNVFDKVYTHSITKRKKKKFNYNAITILNYITI